jgi:hypothetical protein
MLFLNEGPRSKRYRYSKKIMENSLWWTEFPFGGRNFPSLAGISLRGRGTTGETTGAAE